MTWKALPCRCLLIGYQFKYSIAMSLKKTYSLDSFKLRFPIEDVKVLNEILLEKRVRTESVHGTGECISEEIIQTKSFKHDYGYYQIHFAISETFNREEVVILVNSKLLERKYLEGVTMSNIELVYNKIIEANVIYLPFERFMLGSLSDVDIKKDIDEINLSEFEQLTLELERSSTAKTKVGHGVNRINQSTNKGIEWNKRSTATISNPFMKIYHKGLEVSHSKNSSFFSKYVDVDKLKNTVRVEITLKNSKHFKAYGINRWTLKDFLALNQSDIHNICERVIERNLNPRIKAPKPDSI